MLRRQRVRARESFRFGTGMGELSRIRGEIAKKPENREKPEGLEGVDESGVGPNYSPSFGRSRSLAQRGSTLA